ncbi:MAG: radical SAM protein [Proteobacteria bacterium]|nr:radical SAM protein [Pseudomonadota bacterium]
MCGGIHATMTPEAVLETGLFDSVLIGECEYALRDYVRALETKQDIVSIPNTWHKRNGHIIKNNVGPFPGLESLPFKDYAIFDFQKMIDAKNGWVGLMASRGCPFRCTYCFNHQIVKRYKDELNVPASGLNYIRHHPVKNVIDEIIYLQKNYTNIKMYIFDDDLFTFNADYVREFCSEYRKITSIPFVANAHVQIFTPETARCLKEAGCRIIKFGIESGSERVRREILHRPMTNEVIKQAFAIAHEAGLHTSAFVMFGLPHETREDIMATIRILAEIQPGRFRWALFFPYPHTIAYDISRAGGFINFTKMERLNNFTEDSCLDFGPENNLWIDKLQTIFPWQVNACSQFPAAQTYRDLIDRMEALSARSWQNVQDSIMDIERETSSRLTAAGRDHYAIRFNPFMAVRSNWKEDA